MYDAITSVRKRASEQPKVVVLPEAQDPRVIKAAVYLAEKGICEVILPGKEQKIAPRLKEKGANLSSGRIQFFSAGKTAMTDKLIQNLYQRRKDKGMSRKEAASKVKDPLYTGAGLVSIGAADACVAGSVATTGEVIRSAIHCVGIRKGNNTVSSTFLMALQHGQALTYADCGVVPYPDSCQLADIAIESARTHRLLTQEEPIVAMLSFSTKGSADHEKVRLVQKALQVARGKAPGLKIDGEFQFDAAFVPEVGKRKAPESTIAGRANVFIFPNLDAGNIAYKITERLAGASATGPILQGLAAPVMDLSRGCRWEDIVNAACVGILLS